MFCNYLNACDLSLFTYCVKYCKYSSTMNEEKLGNFKKDLTTRLDLLRAKYATKDLIEMAKSDSMSDINDIAASEIERAEYFHIREKELLS